MVSLVKVEVRKGDLNQALKIFKKRVNASGHIDELKQRIEYTKPTTKRRLQKQKAIRNRKLNSLKENNQ